MTTTKMGVNTKLRDLDPGWLNEPIALVYGIIAVLALAIYLRSIL